MTKTEELKEFVTHQAHEDAVLNPSERRYQEKLVSDVLSQEDLGTKLHKQLIELYHAEKLAV